MISLVICFGILQLEGNSLTLLKVTSKMTSLWMGDLDTYMDETFISSAFAAMGEAVVSVKMIKNRTTGSPAGYCFVDFGDYTVSQKVMGKLNGLPIPGSNPIKRFKLNWATYGKESFMQGPEYSIFVGDLSPEVTDYALQEFFQRKFPSCKAAKVVLDTAGNSRPQTTATSTPTAYTTTTATNQQYVQQYQQYQQYLAAWQGYHQQQQQQQQQQQHYYQHYQHYQPYAHAAYQQPTSYEEAAVTVDNTAEDPNPPLNITEENKAIITNESENYFEMEQSRWQSVECLGSGPKSLLT
ncbi:uncharacterized protein LOC141894705 isoform X2 [Acropora palmata]|uniref:uncharacterized protein LOC141894705 isoform X2 n=1 Tax=Acropora palmata TaxID=6131 RepID=UPI003DA06B14